MRDIFLGVRRFDELQRDLGVARNILQARLEHLVDQGIVFKKAYHEHPVRYEYRLTQKGLDLGHFRLSSSRGLLSVRGMSCKR